MADGKIAAIEAEIEGYKAKLANCAPDKEEMWLSAITSRSATLNLLLLTQQQSAPDNWVIVYNITGKCYSKESVPAVNNSTYSPLVELPSEDDLASMYSGVVGFLNPPMSADDEPPSKKAKNGPSVATPVPVVTPTKRARSTDKAIARKLKSAETELSNQNNLLTFLSSSFALQERNLKSVRDQLDRQIKLTNDTQECGQETTKAVKAELKQKQEELKLKEEELKQAKQLIQEKEKEKEEELKLQLVNATAESSSGACFHIEAASGFSININGTSTYVNNMATGMSNAGGVFNFGSK